MKAIYLSSSIIEKNNNLICESGGQIGEGDAKAHSFIDDEEDWSDFADNDFQKSIFEEED